MDGTITDNLTLGCSLGPLGQTISVMEISPKLRGIETFCSPQALISSCITLNYGIVQLEERIPFRNKHRRSL